MPNNLSELRIVNCKISTQASALLLEGLLPTSIRRLSLVEANLNQDNFHHLIELLEESKSLCDLDISWNSLSAKLLSELFEILSSNRIM